MKCAHCSFEINGRPAILWAEGYCLLYGQGLAYHLLISQGLYGQTLDDMQQNYLRQSMSMADSGF